MIQAKVTCPRCGREWIVHEGTSEMDCNCHMYCEDGSKPSDCTLIAQTLNHEASWPYGTHVSAGDYSDDPTHIQYYCTVHERYGYKVPITIPIDWDSWRSNRAHKKYRLLTK